ncbi:MAG: arginine kinase [Candidatus Pacebacteria bacterium]|nr:arginine kinase [Candidatus Paceibacterota bacterium]MBP9058401.1 arginine kinase [Candidatus Paceibacterota bacterium]
MLMAKYATTEVMGQLKDVVTPHGWTAEKAIQSGIDNPDSNIGVYAGDPESYTMLAPLFDPIIREYHKYEMTGHKSDFSLEGLEIVDLDPEGKYVVSTRIRVGRNFAKYAFPSAVSAEDRASLETEVIETLSSLTGELAGKYYSLGGMTEEERAQMVADHFLFKQGDRFLESAGVNRDWPNNRGIFFSNDKKFLVWISEEDSMRIISMQQGADIAEVFTRLATALDHINQKINFAFDDIRGYHTTCPTNLGTAMRASVHIKIPKLSSQQNFEEVCKDLGLSIRGVHGEHSESADGIYDISNKHRLGITEREIFEQLYAGVKKLIELESSL